MVVNVFIRQGRLEQKVANGGQLYPEAARQPTGIHAGWSAGFRENPILNEIAGG
jgi:hypothetical protein